MRSSRLRGSFPGQLNLADLDAPLIGAFLNHLEQEGHNSRRTRNARLAALRSFFSYAALIARVLAIPTKRCERVDVCYLTRPEVDSLLAIPTPRAGSGDETVPCCTSRCRPGCGSRS